MSRHSAYRVYFDDYGVRLVIAENISHAEAVFQRDRAQQGFTGDVFVKRIEYADECVIDDPPPSGLCRPQRSEDGQ